MSCRIHVLLAGIATSALLTAAKSHGPSRSLLEGPVEDVEVMHVLLDDVVTREPREIKPVANLPLHIGPFRLLVFVPQGTLVPVAAAADEFADFAFVDPLHAFDVGSLVPSLGTGHDRQVFLLGLLTSLVLPSIQHIF